MRRLAGLLLFCGSLSAQLTPEQKQLNIASFEKVWTTIRDKHWEKNPGGLDWQAIHDEFRPRIDRAESTDQARAIMREMLARLKQTHFAIFPRERLSKMWRRGIDGRRLARNRSARAR